VLIVQIIGKPFEHLVLFDINVTKEEHEFDYSIKHAFHLKYLSRKSS